MHGNQPRSSPGRVMGPQELPLRIREIFGMPLAPAIDICADLEMFYSVQVEVTGPYCE